MSVQSKLKLLTYDTNKEESYYTVVCMGGIQLESTRSYYVWFFLEINMKIYIPSKYEQVWVQLPMRMTVRIILEAFTYSTNNTKIVRRRLE